MRGHEPLEYFRSIDRFLEEGHGFTEAIVLDPDQAGGLPVGRRFLFDGEGSPRASLPSGDIPRWAVVPDRKARLAAQTIGPRLGSRSCRAGRASG